MGWTFYNSSGQQLQSTAAPTTAVSGRVARTAGNVTTTSTSLVDVTGASVTFTTGAFPVAYGAVMAFQNTDVAYVTFNIDIDSSLELGTAGVTLRSLEVDEPLPGSFIGQSSALSAASHTIKMQWKVSAGTGLINATSTNTFIFWAHEVR